MMARSAQKSEDSLAANTGSKARPQQRPSEPWLWDLKASLCAVQLSRPLRVCRFNRERKRVALWPFLFPPVSSGEWRERKILPAAAGFATLAAAASIAPFFCASCFLCMHVAPTATTIAAPIISTTWIGLRSVWFVSPACV